MTYSVSFGFSGGQELIDLLNQMQIDFGEKDAKNILTSAVRTAMKPVLATAQSLVPVDTGLLRRGLWIEARRPRAKDYRSKYVKRTDAVIALVTTKPIPPKIKKEATAKFGLGTSNEKKKYYESRGYYYDARAVAMEWGTVNVTKRSYLRPALESQGQNVVNSLGENLKTALEKYKAKQARKVIYGR